MTVCVIRVNGGNVSSSVLPRLLNLNVVDKAGSSSDTCQVDIDDAEGVVVLPPEGGSLTVDIGPSFGSVTRIFDGTVDEVRSRGGRASATVLSISAKGFDTKGKGKQPQQRHWDDATLNGVMSDAGKAAGMASVAIDPVLAQIKRPYWAMQTESFMHFGERIAREVGGTFKVVGKRAIIAKRNGGTSAGGAALPSISAVWGVNLISWDIAPVMGRGRYRKIRARHYNRKTAEWRTEDIEVDDEDTDAELILPYPAADGEEAKTAAGSRKDKAERDRGAGTITIESDPNPQPEADVVLEGARPGIDGTYRIDTVTQSYDRSSGWTTVLNVRQPQGAAGKDTRE